jgi:Zn-dependent M28 family amino/carboxypeptidase
LRGRLGGRDTETGPAGYPRSVVKGSWATEQFDIPSTEAGTRVPVEGWITVDKARELFADAGADFDTLHAAAATRDFTPVTLDAKASFDVEVDVRRIESRNVVAKLEGTSRKDEHVIYTAHWDHLGRDTALQGDQMRWTRAAASITWASPTVGACRSAKSTRTTTTTRSRTR